MPTLRAATLSGIFAFGLALAPSVRAEKSLTYCAESAPLTFNPQLTDDGATLNAASRTLYDRLLDFEPGTTKVIPSLAEKWTVSKDAKTYTFTLREGVQFQTTDRFKPTRRLNADDVVFSFERALKRDHAFHPLGGGHYPFFTNLGLDQNVREVKKIDDRTVSFSLKRPEAPFLASLASGFAVILSKEYADQLEKNGMPRNLDIEPVGTGPFQLERYIKDKSVRFKVHEGYWRGRAKLDRLTFEIVPESARRLKQLIDGDCDLIADPAPADLETISGNPKLKLLSAPGSNIAYLAFNTAKKPFDSVLVRRAIAQALPIDAYIEKIYQTRAVRARNPIPPSIWGYSNDTKEWGYDLDKAKKLLRQAGYKNGFETELWTLPTGRAYLPDGRALGEMIQADLAKIGIRVKLVTYDMASYLAKARAGEHQMIEMGWTTDNGDPDGILGAQLTCAGVSSGANLARWCDRAYDRQAEKARTKTDMNERTLLYYAAQKRFNEQLPWIPVAHATAFRGASGRLSGYQISPLGLEDFYPVDVK